MLKQIKIEKLKNKHTRIYFSLTKYIDVHNTYIKETLIHYKNEGYSIIPIRDQEYTAQPTTQKRRVVALSDEDPWKVYNG